MSKSSLVSVGVALVAIMVVFVAAHAQESNSMEPASGDAVLPPSAQTAMTTDHLQVAYNSEVNSHARYLVYADKAEEEGYRQVASMFRALARGEEIHAASLSTLMTPDKIMAAASAESAIALSTKENLELSVLQQTHEKDVMYPQLVKQAREQKNEAAAKIFEQNGAAEPTHLAWCRQALAELNSFKGDNIDFYVCSQCGNTVRALSGTSCPICSAPRDKFERVR